jgi:hypothetical protein
MAIGMHHTIHVAPSVRKTLALTSSTSGSRLVGIVGLQTQGTEFSFFIVFIDNHLFDTLPIQNGLKRGDVISSLLFNFTSKYTTRKVEENQVGLKLSGKCQFLVLC